MFLDTEESNDYNISLDKIETFMDNITLNIFNRPWSQLEIKYKKQKIEDYINEKCIEYELSENDNNTILDFLFKLIKKPQTTKYFKYDKETAKILNIKIITFKDNNYSINSF